jgi:hypothetical protein
MLEREGVRFDGNGRIDLARFRWRPRAYSSETAAAGHVRRRANVETTKRGGRMKRWLVAAVSMWVCLSAAAARGGGVQDAPAQEPAPTLAEIYEWPRRRRGPGRPDAVPAQISTTSLGAAAAERVRGLLEHPVLLEGGSDSHVAINVFRGSMTCWADKGPAGRIPDLKPDFFKDGAALYAIAKKEGGDFIGRVSASTRHLRGAEHEPRDVVPELQQGERAQRAPDDHRRREHGEGREGAEGLDLLSSRGAQRRGTLSAPMGVDPAPRPRRGPSLRSG